MYNTTIGRALAGDIDAWRITDHYLYVVREDITVFYVGQSMQPLTRLQDHLIGMSALGNLILEHQPASYEWTYDLLRPAECSLLNDPEWSAWSDYEIARRTFTSHEFVRQMKITSNVASEEKTYINKYGNVATMNTSNIGRAQPIEPSPVFSRNGIPHQFFHDWTPLPPSARYDSSRSAYCKYCYETHSNWAPGDDYGSDVVWVCPKCDHATRDEFMQIEEAPATKSATAIPLLGMKMKTTIQSTA